MNDLKFDNNPYYSPEKCGLEIFEEIDTADSGCSCPSPFDDHGQRIDGKNLLHCYRLIETGIEIARDKVINVRRPNADFLIEIRKGKHNLEKLLEQAEIKMKQLDEAFDVSTLPDKADRSFFMKLLIKIRQEYYGKHISV